MDDLKGLWQDVDDDVDEEEQKRGEGKTQEDGEKSPDQKPDRREPDWEQQNEKEKKGKEKEKGVKKWEEENARKGEGGGEEEIPVVYAFVTDIPTTSTPAHAPTATCEGRSRTTTPTVAAAVTPPFSPLPPPLPPFAEMAAYLDGALAGLPGAEFGIGEEMGSFGWI